jgi:glycosyltransferase involved in cell wall biosynthesis
MDSFMGTILMVTRPILPPWNEGSKNMAWQIAQRARRHRFHLMTAQSAGQLPTSDSIIWNYVYTDKNFVAKQRLRLLWHLIQGNFDIDVYHFLFVPTPTTSRLLSGIIHLQRKRSIQTVPSLYTPDLSPKDARVLFFADRVVAISDWTADRLQSLGVKNITRINVGVDLDRFKPSSDRDALRKKFSLPPDVPMALFSGELSRLGSTEILLSVIQRILTENPAVHFVFACPVRLPEDILARDQTQQTIHRLSLDAAVHFVGQVDDFSGLLNACDMLLFPVSRMAAKVDTPLTVLEAMAVGLPVIITDLFPLSEVFKADVGIATPLGDNEAFAEAVLELSADENRRRQMGQAGQSVVREHYNVQNMVQAYEELYDELL